MTISSRLGWASAFFIAVALFYAPLAYGCTRPEMLPTLFALLAVAIVTGAISFVIDRGWRAVPKTPILCVTLILIQGWWMTLNPVFTSVVPANGGFVDTTTESIQRTSFDSMLVITFLLPTFLVLCHLFVRPDLRRFLLLATALSGVLISVIGITFKLSGPNLMHHFWKPEESDWNTFAFYRYHGNAGAFLNLAWPIILVFTRRAYAPTVPVAKKILWTFCSLACGSALILNASKAALIIGLVILPWPFLTRLTRLGWKPLVLLGALTLLLIAGGLFASSKLAWEAAFQRLSNAREVSGAVEGRWSDYQTDLDGIPAAGAFGIGPGLFKLAFPYQMSPMRNVGPSVRDYAHEDYLQTALEWGWFGTTWWTVLVAGGLYRAIRTYRRRELFESKTERHLLLGTILGVCGTLAHAFVDFPLQIASIRLFFLLLLALCWVSPQLLTPPTKSATQRKRFRLPIPSPELIKASPR